MVWVGCALKSMRVPVAWGWLTLLVLFATSAAGQFLTDATTGCMVIDVPSGSPGIAYTSPIFGQLATNVSTGATSDAFTVPNCVVCLNVGTIITGVPAPTLTVPLEMIPSFRGTNCIVSTPATNADTANACSAGVCGDGYMSFGEACDDGDTLATGSCAADCLTVSPKSFTSRPSHPFISIDDNDGYINNDINEVIDMLASGHSSTCVPVLDGDSYFPPGKAYCPAYSASASHNVKTGTELAAWQIEAMGTTGGANDAAETTPAVLLLIRDKDVGESFTVQLKSAAPVGAITKNSFAKTGVPSSKMSLYVQCGAATLDGVALLTTAELRGTGSYTVLPNCDTTNFQTSSSTPLTKCKWGGLITDPVNVQDICGLTGTAASEARLYILSDDACNLFVDLTLKLEEGIYYNSFKYPLMFNFMPILNTGFFHAPTIEWVGSVDKEETEAAQLVQLTFTYATDLQTTLYDFSDVRAVRKITVEATNTGTGVDDWSQVTSLDSLVAGDTTTLAEFINLDSNMAYSTYIVDGTFTGRINMYLSPYTSSVLYAGRSTVTITFVTSVCTNFDPANPTAHEFTSTQTSAGLKISAKIFDLPAINSGFTLMSVPATATEGVPFPFTLKWNDLVTTDTSLTHTIKKINFCFTGLNAQKDPPTFAVTTANVALSNCVFGCCDVASTLTLWSDVLAQISGDGWTVTVTTCTSAVDDLQLTAQATVWEPAINGFMEAEATATAAAFRSATNPTAFSAVVNDLEILGSFTLDVTLVAGGPAVDFRVCTAVDAAVTSSNCSFVEEVDQTAGASFTISGLAENAAAGKSLAATSILQSFNGATAAIMGTETGQVTSPTVVAGTLSECNDFSLSATVRAATCGVANFQATRDHKTVEKAASKERQLVVNVDIIEQPMPITIVEKIATAIVLDEDAAITLKDHVAFKLDMTGCACELMTQLKVSFTATDMSIVENIILGGTAVGSTGVVTYTDFTNVLNAAPALFSADEWTFTDAFQISFVPNFNTIGQPTITMVIEVTATDCDSGTTVTSTQTRTITINDIVDTCTLTSQIQSSMYKLGTWTEAPQTLVVSTLDEIRIARLQLTANPGIDVQTAIGQPVITSTSTTPETGYALELGCCTTGIVSDCAAMTITQQQSFWDPVTPGDTAGPYKCTALLNIRVRAKVIDWSGKVVPANPSDCEQSVITAGYGYCSGPTGGTIINSWTNDNQNYFGFLVIVVTSTIQDSANTQFTCTNVDDGTGSTNVLYVMGEFVQIFGEIANQNSLDLSVDSNGVSVATVNVDATQMNNPDAGFLLTVFRQAHQEYNQLQNSLAAEVTINSTCATSDGILVSVTLSTDLENGGTEATWGNYKATQIAASELGLTGVAWSSAIQVGNRLITVKIDDPSNYIEVPCTITIIIREVTVGSLHGQAAVFPPFYTFSEYVYLQIAAENGVIGVVSSQATATQLKTFNVCFDRTGGVQGDIDAVFSLNSYCAGGYDITIDGSTSAQATWEHLESAQKCQEIIVPGIGDPGNLVYASDCNIEIKIDDVVAYTIWLSGQMGSTLIVADQPDYASKAHIANGNDGLAGQAFKMVRQNAQLGADGGGEAKFKLTSTVVGLTLTPAEFVWALLDEDTERSFTMSAPSIGEVTTVDVNVQLQVRDLNGDFQDQGAATQTILALVDDISTCGWNLFKPGGVVGVDTVLEDATVFSDFLTGYVALDEGVTGALVVAEGATDTLTHTVNRTSVITSLSFKIRIVHAKESFASIQTRLLPEHFSDSLDTVYTFAPGEYTVTVTLHLVDDAIYHPVRHGLFHAEYFENNHYGAAVTVDVAAALTAGCLSHMPDNTIFSNGIVNLLAVMDEATTRRLLTEHKIDGGTNVVIAHDDDAATALNMPATEATTARFWSTASLDTWDNSLNVEMTFDVPVYTTKVESDRYYGSWAQLGGCPTPKAIDPVTGDEDWSDLFTNMVHSNTATTPNQPSICSTFVPLTDGTSTSDALLYARTLAGLVGSSGTELGCNNTAWPCSERWKEPIVPGFENQVDMTGHRLTNVDQFLPVYPYKYSGTLTQLQDCMKPTHPVAPSTATTWNGIVTTSSSSAADGSPVTAYGFETCIVTYGPRFWYSNNTDLIVHTATQKVSLSSSNEAVVTAIMFDMADDLRVSMIPEQKSCTKEQCTAQFGYNFGPQLPCTVVGSTDNDVHLELDTAIDVPLAPNNDRPFTGVMNILTGITTPSPNTGCHLSSNPLEYNNEYQISAPLITEIERFEKRGGSTEYVKYTYVRSAFTLNTPCIGATTPAGVVVENAFMTCPAGKVGTDYDFNVQFVSCTTLIQIQQCGIDCAALLAPGGGCIKSGHHGQPTLIQADITFSEWPPNSEMAKSTSIALLTNTFKYGSSTPVDFKNNQAKFNTKDTIVIAVAPVDGSSFSAPNFGLVCPKIYMSAYNPVSPGICTTSQAEAWTYGVPANPSCSHALQTATSDQTFDYCQPVASYPTPGGLPYDTVTMDPEVDCSLPFPAALFGVSVMFTGVQRVRTCLGPTTPKMWSHSVDGVIQNIGYKEVSHLDATWKHWETFYSDDYRAKTNKPCQGPVVQGTEACAAGGGDHDYQCALVGSCQQACWDHASNGGSASQKSAQTDAGCGDCSITGGGHIASQWILPFVAHQRVVSQGVVSPGFTGSGNAGSDITAGMSDVRICKSEHAVAGNADSFGREVGYTTGWGDGGPDPETGTTSAPGICEPNTASSTEPSNSVAKPPRYCGFPDLTQATGFKAGTNPTPPVSENKYITAGLSISAAGLKPNKLYSVALYCYITNCQAGGGTGAAEGAGTRRLLGLNNGSRRLLSADEHDVVVVDDGEFDEPLTAAAGIHLLQIRGEVGVEVGATPAPVEVCHLHTAPLRISHPFRTRQSLVQRRPSPLLCP